MTIPAFLPLRLPALLCCTALLIAATQEQPSQPQSDPTSTPAQSAPQSTISAVAVDLFPSAGWTWFPSAEFKVEATAGDGDGNEVRLLTNGLPERLQEMQRRLQDPEQRPLVRAEQRTSIQDQNAEIAEVLQLDAATTAKLIDLLTDRQMAQLDELHSRLLQDRTRGATVDTITNTLQARADAETRSLTALRELLGEQGLERYQSYSTTLAERGEVNRLDARLQPGSKLQPAQKDRLIALIQEQHAYERQQDAVMRAWPGPFPRTLSSPDALARHAALQGIEMNQESLRRMQESGRVLLQRAAQILNAEQLAVLALINAEKINGQRRWIEQARVQAGLDREVPDPAEPSLTQAPLRTPVAGNVKFEISLTVNGGKPTTVTHVGANGEPIEFEAGDGLFVTATPTLFDDRWLDVQLRYYEQGRDGQRRRLDSTASFGTLSTMPDGTPGRGGSDMVVTGAKGYAVIADGRAEAL